MTFSIEPDLTSQKVSTLAGRKETSRAPSDAGEEFARFLAQDTREQDADPQTQAASNRKAADTEGSAVTPLLHAEASPDELLADTPQESDVKLPAIADPEVDVQEELTAKAGNDKAGTIEADDASDADEAQVLLAQTTSLAQTEPAPATMQPADAIRSSTAAQADPAAVAPDAAIQNAVALPEAQSMLVTATNPEATKPSTSRTSTETQRTITATAVASASTPGKLTTTGKPSSETEALETFSMAELSSDNVTRDTKHAAGTSPAPDGTLLASAPAASPAPASQPAQVQQPQMTPTNALVTASPADTVKIITDTIAAPDDAPDRITVQLDPPELGRVSIDFKFDSHGLQHVTVTGENPEALRQLRLMHFELTQALERSGLSSQNMTFQQQQSGQQQAQSSPARSLFSTQDSDTSNSPLITPAVQPARPPRTAGGGLNIRL
jgi:flagellar hook-length control protein FliK